MATGRVPTSDIEAESLASELRAYVKSLYRMQKELERHGVWHAVASACTDLSRARAQLNLKR